MSKDSISRRAESWTTSQAMISYDIVGWLRVLCLVERSRGISYGPREDRFCSEGARRRSGLWRPDQMSSDAVMKSPPLKGAGARDAGLGSAKRALSRPLWNRPMSVDHSLEALQDNPWLVEPAAGWIRVGRTREILDHWQRG
jgi:hypothetical protein